MPKSSKPVKNDDILVHEKTQQDAQDISIVPDISELVVGEIPEHPWQFQRYAKRKGKWQPGVK